MLIFVALFVLSSALNKLLVNKEERRAEYPQSRSKHRGFVSANCSQATVNCDGK